MDFLTRPCRQGPCWVYPILIWRAEAIDLFNSVSRFSRCSRSPYCINMDYRHWIHWHSSIERVKGGDVRVSRNHAMSFIYLR